MRIFIFCLILSLLNLSAKAADMASYNYDYSMDDDADTSVVCNDLDDPFEKVNRKIFYFNSFLDYIILKPVAKAYGKYVNDYTRNRVGNFVDNIYEPLTTVNYGLQLDLKNTLSSFWKFVLNSTIGVVGLYDVATDRGLNHQPQTFGSTLARYGVSPGPYIVLPILGGTNMRDMWDSIVADDMLNPLKYQMHGNVKLGYSVVRIVHKRNEIMPFTDYIAKSSTDPYSALRSALHQRRESTLLYPSDYKCGHRPFKNKSKK